MKFALRTICKVLSAASSAIDELRYEADIQDRDILREANRKILDARRMLHRLLEK